MSSIGELPRQIGKFVALQVQFLQFSAERDGVGQRLKVVSVQGEHSQLLQSSDGGRQESELGVVEVHHCQVREAPELYNGGKRQGERVCRSRRH